MHGWIWPVASQSQPAFGELGRKKLKMMYTSGVPAARVSLWLRHSHGTFGNQDQIVARNCDLDFRRQRRESS